MPNASVSGSRTRTPVEKRYPEGGEADGVGLTKEKIAAPEDPGKEGSGPRQLLQPALDPAEPLRRRRPLQPPLQRPRENFEDPDSREVLVLRLDELPSGARPVRAPHHFIDGGLVRAPLLP